MKNVIFLVIDSLNYSHVLETKGKLMPFLDELEKKYVSCEDMYSQAPYTEAAVMGIYCGQNVLDNGGYIERYNKCPKTIFEAYRENGYDVYYNSFQPQVFPSSLRRGITDLFCNVGYDFGALWHYRLEHYSKIDKLDLRDYEDLFRILEENFAEWKRFLVQISENTKEVQLIVNNNNTFCAAREIEKLEKEITLYYIDKKEYVDNLLATGKKHALFNISHFKQNNKVKNVQVNTDIRRIMMSTYKRIKKLNLLRNLRNNPCPIKPLIKVFLSFVRCPSKKTIKNCGKAILSVVNTYIDPDLKNRFLDPGNSKNAVSLEKHMDHFFQWENCRNKKNPYFACIHVDDIHGPEAFFTYDSEDIEQIKEENKSINEYLDKLPKNFKGSISHDLSLIYIDNVLRKIFVEFERRNMLEDTVVYIMADHGFAFSWNPIRVTMGIDFFLENYHIPFVMVDKSKPHKRIKGLRESKDIPVTALENSQLPIPINFTGKSIFKEAYKVLGIEYCGSGCPDLRRRKIMLGAFNKEELIATKKPLYINLTEKDISEMYDLIKDPRQERNSANKQEINIELLRHIIKRREEILKKV